MPPIWEFLCARWRVIGVRSTTSLGAQTVVRLVSLSRRYGEILASIHAMARWFLRDSMARPCFVACPAWPFCHLRVTVFGGYSRLEWSGTEASSLSCKATVNLCALDEFQCPKIGTTQITRPFGGRFYRLRSSKAGKFNKDFRRSLCA